MLDLAPPPSLWRRWTRTERINPTVNTRDPATVSQSVGARVDVTEKSGPGGLSAADVLLRSLHARGVEYLFANPGTDFPSIIESFAQAAEIGTALPHPVLVPHENAAVSMAHGAYLVSGKPQAVMVHVSVGTGNTVNALMNASRDNVPLLLLAGRSPVTESGPHGTRSGVIHWAQEMFDQAGMVRELVKWDYELRRPDQVGAVTARAVERAISSPRGPVYLSLPREPLAAASPEDPNALQPREIPAPPHPQPQSVARLADWILAAEHPLIITSNSGRSAGAMRALARVAERFALPVVTMAARSLCLPSDHPMLQGDLPAPLLRDADLVLVLECEVPWIPSVVSPPAACRVAHIGEDPAFSRYPMRSFRSDLSITADAAVALAELERALEQRLALKSAAATAANAAVASRRAALTKRSAEIRAQAIAESDAIGRGGVIKPAWISRCLGEAIDEDAIVMSEYWLRLQHCRRVQPGSFFALSPAGGLGWALGAALGAKLVAPERLVVAAIGDGAYMFANPTACHWVAAAHDLPVLTVVFNNRLYGAVKNSTLNMYAGGAAARRDGRVLADLGPDTAYERIIEAHDGYGARVESPADLPGVLAEAVRVVKQEKRQALVNVIGSS
ncbi:MAG: thiamine pyrophosphate-requiring protein [Betaproteobacteria bacterium]|nr:thiamine pyrophosphate-requiring protein [Betaproteobacteria bacterium]